MESSKEDQRSVDRFLTAEGVGGTDIHWRMSQEYGEHCMSLARVKAWHKHFREGWVLLADDARSGTPHRITDDIVQLVDGPVTQDCRVTVKAVATEAGLSIRSVHTIISKFHELIPVVENKDLYRLHVHLEQTPSRSCFKNFTRHNITLGSNKFFNNGFGRLMGIKPLFRGIRVALIDPFFITCDNSPDKCIIPVITNKLMTDIHSILSLLRYQFMRYRSTASVWFSNCLNLAIYGIFWCIKFFWQHTSTFLRIFFQNSVYILNNP